MFFFRPCIFQVFTRTFGSSFDNMWLAYRFYAKKVLGRVLHTHAQSKTRMCIFFLLGCIFGVFWYCPDWCVVGFVGEQPTHRKNDTCVHNADVTIVVYSDRKQQWKFVVNSKNSKNIQKNTRYHKWLTADDLIFHIY